MNKKGFLITYYCDKKIEHDYITYNEFKTLLISKDLKEINFTKKYIQKYYMEYSNKENEIIDYPNYKKNFI